MAGEGQGDRLVLGAGVECGGGRPSEADAGVADEVVRCGGGWSVADGEWRLEGL